MPTAAQDLNDKLKLEAKLRPELRRYNSMLVREFKREYVSSGNVLNIFQFDVELEDILRKHYDRTGLIFSNRITPDIPLDVGVTEGERDIIDEALAIWLIGQASQQANIINSTSQADANAAVAAALEDPLVREEVGRSAQLTAAAIAGALFNRKLRGRETGILMTETQIPSETAKATEAEVLSGLPPSIQGGSPRTSQVDKEWATVGDSRVREIHLNADGQKRPVNEPFIVNGELLRWPSDSELGASAGNVINCRCSSIIKTAAVIAVRRER